MLRLIPGPCFASLQGIRPPQEQAIAISPGILFYNHHNNQNTNEADYFRQRPFN